MTEYVVGHAVFGSQTIEVGIREQSPVGHLPGPHVDTGRLGGILRWASRTVVIRPVCGQEAASAPDFRGGLRGTRAVSDY